MVAALGAVAIGAILALGRRTFEAGIWTQAVGAAGVGVAGFLALASGDTLGTEFTSSIRSAFRRRRPERALPRHARPHCGSRACVLAPLSGAHAAGTCDCGAHRGLLPRPCACCLRPRSVDVPHGLGADDAAVGHGDPRRAPGRQAVAATVFDYPARHPSRRVGTWIGVLLLGTRTRRGGPLISSGSGLQITIALAALWGWGRKAGVMHVSRLAPAGSSDRAGAGFGAR